MKARTALLILIIVMLGYLAFFNFPALSQVGPMSLGFATIEAPLGLVMLALTSLMAVIFVAYVIAMQGTWLLEARAHAKEIHAQRELADKAEASRFTELRMVLQEQYADNQRVLIERMDVLEAHLEARAQESDNSTAAYVGQLEQHLRKKEAE